jgi:hypothetical protein
MCHINKGWCPRSSCNWMDCFQHVNSGASYGLHVQWVRSGACMRQTCLRAGAGWCEVFNTIQYNTFSGLKPAPALASAPIVRSWGVRNCTHCIHSVLHARANERTFRK